METEIREVGMAETGEGRKKGKREEKTRRKNRRKKR